jgi:hypothetical protein
LYSFNKEQDIDKYIKYANKFDVRCNKDSLIGDGTYGVCFKIDDNNAVKITCDLSEVCVSIGMMKGHCASYPKIKEVSKIEGEDVWVIKQELCQPLSPKDYRVLNKVTNELNYYLEEFEKSTFHGLSELVENGDLDHFEEEDLIDELLEAVENVSKMPLLRDLDLHVDNIMRINGNMVLIDQKDTHLDNKRVLLQDKILSKYLSGKELVDSDELEFA